MAQTIAIRTSAQMKDIIKHFLETVCGFTSEAVKEMTKNQGNDNLDKFYLINEKEVDTLCSIVRKPHKSASGAKSGHAIFNLAQEPLKLAIFAMKHYKCLSHKIDLEMLSMRDIFAFRPQHQMERPLRKKPTAMPNSPSRTLPRPLKL
jgi:hypothetical protein